MTTGERLQQLRNLRGFSQQQMADALGVKRTTYAKWEKDANKPSRKLDELAQYFGVTSDYILCLTDSPHESAPAAKPPAPALTQREQTLLDTYRVLDDFGRESVDITAKREYSRVKANAKNKTEDAAM